MRCPACDSETDNLDLCNTCQEVVNDTVAEWYVGDDPELDIEVSETRPVQSVR